jgi:predicted lipoprotein
VFAGSCALERARGALDPVGVVDRARGQMIRFASLLFVAPALLLLLSGCKIVSNKDLVAEQKQNSDTFDANAYVTKVWTPQEVDNFKAKAVDLGTLLPAIEADPGKAGQTYGRGGGEGNPWSYEVKGEGKVTAVDVESRHGLMTVEIATKDGPRPVDLQIGPVIFGTALRDSLPFVHFGDFVNQIQFAQISRAFNDRATKDLRSAFDPKTILGKTVAFYGAATQGAAAGKLSVTPISIETGKAAP